MATDRKLGILGRKLGMTQVFGADGKRYGVTVVECGPCTVLAKKTKEKDGYSALQLSFGEVKEKHATKAELGHAKKANTGAKRWVREFRVTAEVAGKYEVGAKVAPSELFTEGELLDVTAKTKGRGYTGVMKRWNFSGAPAAHGHHEFYRHGGSIGNREFPGRVFKNRKMAGQYGNERVTVQNVKLVKLVADKHLVLVHGAVPGGTNQLVILRSAVKAKQPKA